MAVQFTVRAHQIAGLLDRAPPGIEVLSLDCFDTLVWRSTHSPADVFAGIDLPGGAMGPRQWSEGAARRIVHQSIATCCPMPTTPRSVPPSPPSWPRRHATPSPSRRPSR